MKTMKNRKKGAFTAIAALGAMCVGLCSFAVTDYAKQAGAYNAANPAPTTNSIGEITLDDYDTRTDGLVFNGTALNKLYGKLVNAATGTPTASSDITTAISKIDASSSTVNGSASTGNPLTQNKSLDFKTMQTQLGSAITLKFGGLEWTVMYATTNTTSSADGTTTAGDLVVTLWLNDNIGTNSKWSAATADTSMSGNYPTNMYSASYIRVATLNAGGDDGQRAGNTSTDGTAYYATSTTARSGAVSLADRKTNQFAKYTLSNAKLTTTRTDTDPISGDPVTVTEKPSLTDYLTVPANVEYQRAENWVWSYMGSGNPYLCPNEAWGDGTDGVTGPNTSTRHTAGSRTGGWYTSTPSNMSLMLGKTPQYYEWKEDYLWLPSLTETGYYTSGSDYGASLWGIPANDPIIKSTAPSGTGVTDVSWLRSGVNARASNARGLDSSGAWYGLTVSSVGGVRPALHLNLSSAALSAAVEIDAPTAPTPKTYNAQDQYLSGESWYDTTIFGNSSICGSTYVDATTNAAATPKDVGKYKATFELKGTKYTWATGDKSDKKRSVTYEIKPKELEVDFHIDLATGMPTLALKTGSAPYASDNANTGDFELLIHYYDMTGKDMGTSTSALDKGVQYQAVAEFGGKRGKNYAPDDKTRLTFTNPATRVVAKFAPATQKYTGAPRPFGLEILDGKDTEGLATVEWADDYDDVSVNDANTLFYATNAGKYGVTLTLTNTTDYVWDSTGRTDPLTIYFEITPLDVNINLSGFNPSSYIITEGSTASAYIELNSLKSGDAFTVYLAAYYGTTNYGNLCSLDMSSTVTQKNYVLDTSDLPVLTYKLKINSKDCSDAAAQNYNFVLDKDYSITIREPSGTGGLNWRLMTGGAVVGNKTDSGDTTSTVYTNKIYYSGEEYYFSINASGLDLRVDTSYNDDGFIDGYKTVKRNYTTPLTSVKDAGDYTTYVRLVGDDGADNYRIDWTISKAKFDLSGVYWKDDGQISYDEKGMSVILDPDTVPKGLKPTIGGSHTPLTTSGTQSGRANVTFTVTDTKNYEVPDKTDPDTYIFNDSSRPAGFEWEKDWTVSPTMIPVAWTIGTVNAAGGKKVNAEVLAGGYDSYLSYVYYETDSMGNKLDPTAAGITELTVVEGNIKNYIAEVSIHPNFVGKYELDPSATDLTSPVFEVGHLLQSVSLAAKKTTYTYWGQPVDFQFTVTGSLTESAFEIVYYKGTLRQVNVPKDVGSYTAQISLKSQYTNNYYIDGRNAFDYTIERAVIKIDWNEGTKPPALKVNADEKAAITYEYSDSTGNTVGFGALSTPGVYGVRAVIRSASQKNYIFDNDSTATGWVQFTITSSDTPVNPDTSSPFNPTVDPNNPNGGGSGNQKFVRVELSNYSAQVGNARTQVVNDAGLPSSAFKLTCTLNGNPVSDFSVAGTYEVAISLDPQSQYASEYVLTGQTTYFYTVIGEGGLPGTTQPGTGNNPSNLTIESLLPVILSGVSLVLIVVFGVMSMNSASAAKEAKEKTKKLATMTYSFAPGALLAVFGLSQSNWWIIAGVLMGLALVMAIVAFMFKGKKRKALAALEEEQLRVSEEKEFAKEEKAREEQQRRDNEMRMMFASMQQNYQQQPINYDALQNAIASSVSALLPAMQQMMALPPASPDVSVYNTMPNPEADALRAQLAAQEERMAQQQDLLNQILQNQQNYVMPLYEDDMVEDDISWLGDSDEVVSLEESYGALSDEGRRAYYEIGSYIMSKPRTSQNDGKYAVLFKYRGKTLFKLCIKNDAPVLYYPAGGGRSEIRISDDSLLEFAKSIIDRQTIRVDSEMN